MLAAARADNKPTGSLLLIGDAVSPSADYPELRKAAAEIENVDKHFPPAQQHIFAREHATPAAYLESKPEQFSYIHFVAHGTASRTNPLDSAIVLSKTGLSKAGAADDSFKLYARDIIHHPLHAELVTISTCYGAGSRAYSGEGLVGLSWAFLRTGAHNVIGALWEVSDVSTPGLMDELYAGLKKGKSPEDRSARRETFHAALRPVRSRGRSTGRRSSSTPDRRAELQPAPLPPVHLSRRRSIRRDVSLCEGLVRRCRRPANDHQENIKHEEGDGCIVQQRCLGQTRPELIGRPT